MTVAATDPGRSPRRSPGRAPRRRLAAALSFRSWPAWAVFAPVAAYALGCGLRHGDLSLPAIANPVPGRDGRSLSASKSALLASLGPEARARTAPAVALDRGERAPTLAAATALASAAGIGFPLVAKPDRGTGGKGVRRIDGPADLAAWISAFPPGERFLLQRLVDLPNEAGIMYARRPGEAEGRVIGLAVKDPAVALGDGASTLRALIEAHPHARHLRRSALAEHAARLDHVPAPGERVELVFARNRSGGASCRAAGHLATPALSRAVERIARAIPGFHVGRLDVRFDTPGRLAAGEGFQVIEVNCGISEPLDAWDPASTAVDVWRAYFRQLDLIYGIGAANRALGHRPPGTLDFLRTLARQLRQGSRIAGAA